uniref:Uncharacterized protein n=1 Tax=Haptolina ericina TaxID=156174 RepID=A0A7S3EVY2_9EUKA
MMGEIMGMMQAAPTPALAAMLTALRGKHNKPALSHGSSMHISKSSDVAVPAPEASALPAATAAQLKAIHSGRATLLRQILLAYFRRHFTAGLPKVEDLVARVVGGPPTFVEGVVVGGVLWTEQELFAKLEAKYGAKVDLDPHDLV